MERKTHNHRSVLPEVAALLSSARSSGEFDTYAGKRHSTRVSESLQLEITKDPSRPGAIHATSLHNVSEGGCSFWFRQKLERQTRIYVREFSADNSLPWINAFVTHCTQGIQGYLLGVSFCPSDN